jgi:hypothetical protein
MASRRKRWTSFVDIMEALNEAQGFEKGSNLGLSQATDISYSNAGAMRHRKVIPATYWPDLLEACERFKLSLSSDDLVQLLSRAKKKRRTPGSKQARTVRSAVPRRVSTVRSSAG